MSDSTVRIVNVIPKDFWQYLDENIHEAFIKAHSIAWKCREEPERIHMLGQARHVFCEEGFRKAAGDSGLDAIVLPTKPAGGRYSLVSHAGVYLIRGNVQKHCGLPRATRFRKERAQLNAHLDPLQYDLLRIVTEPSTEQLCAMIVVTAYRGYGDPSIPAFVGLGVPRSDMSEWVIREPIHKLLGHYHDLGTKSHAPSAAPVKVKRTEPRLKKELDEGTTD